MGRMFRIITEGNLDYSHSTATATETENIGNVPFVEVGGPTPLYSNGAPRAATSPRVVTTFEPAVRPLPTYEPAVRPLPVEPATVRNLPLDDRYLSVALHQIAPRQPEPAPVPVTSPIHPEVVAYHHPEHLVSQEYRGLRDELRRQVGHENGTSRAVLFTAASSDNGTTTVLLNLAVTLAKENGSRVLVIDADLDRPSAARKMGVSDVPGLSEVLTQSIPLAWVLQPTVVARLQVLGSGKPADGVLPAMSTDFPRLVTQLRQWFDWILIDGGVWGERPHRDATSPAYDGIYLVTRQTELDRPVFHNLRTQVAKHGGLLRGFITTRG